MNRYFSKRSGKDLFFKLKILYVHTLLNHRIRWNFLYCTYNQIIFFKLTLTCQHSYALSIYGPKIILDRPNHFGRVPIVLDRSKLFWTGLSYFGQVKIIRNSPEKSNLYLTKTVWTWPKQFAPAQNKLDGPKSFWTYKRTRH